MSVLEQIAELKKDLGGKPLKAYFYDLTALTRHVQRFVQALPPQCRYFYAIKANSEHAMLEALAPHVHGFEVASIGEVHRVRAVSLEAPIIFGGPGKADEELEGAIDQRVTLLHVESLHELARLEEIAGRKGAVMDILLRVNLRGPLPSGTLQMAGVPTQFGIDEQVIGAAIRQALRCAHVRLQGFHFHSLSNNLDVEQHLKMVGHYARKARSWADEYGFELRYINAGGGVGVNYADLAAQFDFETFAAALPDQLQAAGEGVTVLFECGRYAVASCGYYATEVLEIRHNHGQWYAVVEGGLHHFLLPGAWKHTHPMTVVPVERWPYPFERPEVQHQAVTVAGKMHMPKDILAHQVQIERLRAGDLLLFPYAGAYGWAISAHDFSDLEYPELIYYT
ncbi:diaminopimelate decarboxylase [Tumebacillus sp. BK434]|uniref:type III PLP-dependent enzyme n=1 Tax=Tumebacillus sp. BK434 TaxID=2512169 RepID=UPI0010E7CB57|nr:type III PLP-dependent enzyme [Tumebacillus sp. BK434]TCP55754.1 diaminopimelate decarboxylase [Tumebacillus sp. BK434]